MKIIVNQLLGPRLPIDNLPKNEHSYVRHIEGLLLDIGWRCEEFRAAVALFEESSTFLAGTMNRQENWERYSLSEYWRRMAAREAAATIYRVRENMAVASDNLHKCPSLRPMVDLNMKRNATKVFNQHFPGYEGLRHSGQHYADLYGSPESLEKHSIAGLHFVNSLVGQTMLTVFKGEVLTLHITAESLANLREVRDLFWGAFLAAGR